jgi:hypothetical protein
MFRVTLLTIWVVGCVGSDKSQGDSAGLEVLTDQQYLEQYPTAYCEFLERCSQDTLDDSFAGSVDECIIEITTWGRDRLGTCSMNGEAAAVCVDGLPDAACADWSAGVFEDSCGAILDCSG